MTNPYVGMPVVKSPSLAELDDRARAIFRRIVETQATGERRGFTRAEFEALFTLAQQGVAELVKLQKAAVG